VPTSHVEDPNLAFIVGLWDRLADECKQRLVEAVRTAQQASPYGSGGGGVTYIVPAPTAVINPGISNALTGQTVQIKSGGSLVTVNTNATIYNCMQVATAATYTLIVGPNNDGTYTVITQSCP